MKNLGVAFFTGVLCEMLLICARFTIPDASFFSVSVKNFLVASHYPLYRLADRVESPLGEFAMTVFLFAGMSGFWGLVLYASWFMLYRTALTRHRRLIVGGFVTLGALALGLRLGEGFLDRPAPFERSPETRAMTDGNNAFAIDLYHDLAGRPGNLFFSPFSISTGLGMAYLGARGGTEAEMSRALHFSLPQNQAASAFGPLVRRAERLRRWRQIDLTTANSVWVDSRHPLRPAFADALRANFHADARTVDFHEATKSAGAINDWVSAATGGRIQRLLDPGLLTRDGDESALVLCNAIYFKGRWRNQFKPRDTKPMAFQMDTNRVVTIPMMHQKCPCKMAMIRNYSGRFD
jgi:hypothetical protein